MSPTPAKRLAQVQQHLSTAATTPDPNASKPVVFFEAVHSLRKLTLNRPKALNSLNDEMVQPDPAPVGKMGKLGACECDSVQGSRRSFCAGGDVRTLVEQLEDPKTRARSSEFFEKEYGTDAYIAKMKTPIVSFIHGNTLGGGVGLAVHAPFRVATETTKIGMPETKIGLFPDVGGNFFLSRMDGALGLFLGLTGQTVSGAGTLFAGFATHFVPQAQLEALEARLAELSPTASAEDVNNAIEEFSADANDLQVGKYEWVGAKRRAIDAIFSKKTAEEIMADLKALEEGTLKLDKIVRKGEEGEVEGLKTWATQTRELLEKRSPTSIKLTILMLREGKSLDIDNAFRLDMRVATACCNPEVHPDFLRGVTHVLIDKTPDSGPRTAWSPSTLPEVDVANLQKIFFSNPAPFDNPPVPSMPLPEQAPSYKSYPHKFGLPTENEIRDIITGEDKSSDDYAMLADEVVSKIVRQRNGKVGVREKVEEVIKRRCTVEEGGTLKWRF